MSDRDEVLRGATGAKAEPAGGRFRLVLAKEDFKFSVAHFTVFSADEAERLHGHNYRVSIELSGREVSELGLMADVARVKAEVRALCAELDSHTLLPTESPLVSVGRVVADVDADVEAAAEGEGGAVGGLLEVRYGDREYRMPAADVVLLPLVNTTMELFARHIWQRLAPSLADTGVDALSVSVEETDGQRCVYEGPLPPG